MNAATSLTWLIAFPLVASPVIYIFGRLLGKQQNYNPARWMSILTMLGTWFFLYAAGTAYLTQGPISLQTGSVVLRMDGISLILAFVALLLTTLVSIFSLGYMAGEPGEEKYYTLLTIMTATMIGLGCSGDLFNLWVWFEAMAISSYMLVTFYREQASALEAGIKYLVQSAVGSALVLFGIALVFFQTGTLDMAKIHMAVQSPSPILMAAGALFVIGFGVKTALVPLHTWLPDAHSQAPSGISAMLSGVVIEAGLIAMLRSIGALAGATIMWGPILMVFAAFNMIIGNLMALRQKEVKRLLAYSSVSHIGYMLVGLAAAIGFGQANGAGGAFFHLLTHAMMKGLAFLSAGALLYALHIANNDHGPLTIDDLSGAAKRYPLAAFAFSVAVLGLGGLPPLAGFMSKWQIFVAGFQTQNTWMIVLVVFAALNSVLSLGYYGPLVNRLYRKEPGEIILKGQAVPDSISFVLVVLSLAVILLGFVPSLVDWLTSPAASSLLAIMGK
jgi:proton-translocating NADH-quinone oxidoreductase chain N